MSKRVSARAVGNPVKSPKKWIPGMGVVVEAHLLNLRAKAVLEAYAEYLKGNVGELAPAMANLEKALIP